MNPIPTGPQFWRSLDELAQSPAFIAQAQREFPTDASVWEDELSRRNFLKMMAASFALAGLTACGMPQEKIVPYVREPEGITPGNPLSYATVMTLGGYALGLLVQSREGRPLKIEGNPQHPASLGATDVFAQASILSLYDPHRSQAILRGGAPSSWNAFAAALRDLVEARARIRILTETITSPTLAALLKPFQWHSYEPINNDNARAGARLVFGQPVETRYRFDQADVVLSLDADFLMGVRYAHDFMARRRVRAGTTAMNRLYVIESSPTNTGAVADHCRRVRPTEIEALARALLAGNTDDRWLAAVAKDLRANRGLVVPGNAQLPSVHAIAHLLNEQLGNNGVEHTEPVAAQGGSLDALVTDMTAGNVDALLILGGNPVQSAPGFLDAMRHVRTRIQLSLYRNETTPHCHWHVPESHFLEAWGDARAFDGTASIQQPLIAPLYQTRSAIELLAPMRGQEQSGHELVRRHWQLNDNQWETALHDGVIPGTTLPAQRMSVTGSLPAATPASRTELEVVIRPNPTLYDGRFAPNGWLQELPKPLTRLTWDNVAWVSPATAQRLAWTSEDVVELELQGRVEQRPVWIVPGCVDDVVTLHLPATLGGAGFSSGLQLKKVGERQPVASVQLQQTMEGRDLVRVGSLAQFIANPNFAQGHEPKASLYPGYEYKGLKWGMVIDLGACVGCAACVVACQAENNIPVVGKEEVARGRSMHWLRIDRYYEGDAANPATHFAPVPCMHCENAPCEVVCPVAATVHDGEGLNQMVYNRCVGTRYCSNNCPYKVRRFNFLPYTDTKAESLQLLWSPEVTVRNRGVMEKCTYCIQRIQRVKITAKVTEQPLPAFTTACAQACPTAAIVFGNLNDARSPVAQLAAQPHNYGLLSELNTRPRTTYLARVRNPNPELEAR